MIALIWLLQPSQIYASQVPDKKVIKSKVSWYGEEICKGRQTCKTASGRLFEPKEYTAACWGEYPFFTTFRVTYNDRSVVVVCTDRGAFKKLGRFLDLSSGAFEQLAPLSKGVLTVKIEEIKNEKTF